MIKSIFTAAAVLALVAPNAMADSQDTVEVVINYNATQLATQAGTADYARSIETQAREACRYTPIGTVISRVDTDCVSGIVETALSEINEQSAQADEATPFASARLTTETQTSFQ